MTKLRHVTLSVDMMQFLKERVPEGVFRILEERLWQLTKYSAEHDAEHDSGELGLAAALDALPYETVIAGEPLLKQEDFINLHIALETGCNFHVDPIPSRIERLTRAGALIAAEIDRLIAWEKEDIPSFERF